MDSVASLTIIDSPGGARAPKLHFWVKVTTILLNSLIPPTGGVASELVLLIDSLNNNDSLILF